MFVTWALFGVAVDQDDLAPSAGDDRREVRGHLRGVDIRTGADDDDGSDRLVGHAERELRRDEPVRSRRRRIGDAVHESGRGRGQ